MSQEKSYKMILFWTDYFYNIDFEFGTGFSPFQEAQCANTGRFTCFTTNDRGFFNQSDAILFHGRNMNPEDLPPPGWRRQDQHFVFVLHESPVHTNLTMLRYHFKNYFNRTMTYRRDSDIVHLYTHGQLKCKNTTLSCQNFPRVNSSRIQEDFPPRVPFPIDLSKKNRTVAWFVTNCNASNNRERFVDKLSFHIDVDIYGGCSERRCETKNEESCLQMLSQYYRFYLSFENSLCPDYATEKLYRPLLYDTVPVVFGGSDYSHFVPVGSFIDTRDFSSPLQLASYLKKLMVDDELYLSYFRWRWRYFVDAAPLDGWCQLCQLLSNSSTKPKVYPDIEGWWAGTLSNDKKCFDSPVSLVGNKESLPS